MLKSLSLAALLSLGVASTASATVVFNDDFNYGPTTFTNASNGVFGGTWATTAGSVDYLAPPPANFSNLCQGTGGCVDLDGSTNNAGLFSTVQSFGAGTYTLAIGLFGSLRGTTESVTISLGSWSETISNILSGADASDTFTFTTTGGTLNFQNGTSGPNSNGDNIGAVLTSVNLAAVPLPAGGFLMLGALAGLAGLRRRMRNA